MDGNDKKNGKTPEITIVERRRHREAELSSAELMKILRKRARCAGKGPVFEVKWEEKGRD